MCCLSHHVLPRPHVSLLSSWHMRADLSKGQPVLNMAGHLSVPPEAVRIPFNLTCNFPGEVYKSHKQNFNIVKYLMETVSISFSMKTFFMLKLIVFKFSMNWVICIPLLK